MMPPSIRRVGRFLLAVLLAGSFLVTLVLLLLIPSDDISPSLGRKEFVRGGDDGVGIVTNLPPVETLNAVRQEVGAGIKLPTGTVYKDEVLSDILDSQHNSSVNINDQGVETAKDSGTRNYGGGHHVSGSSAAKDSRHRPMTREKLKTLEDQLITAKAYLHFFPKGSNSRLLRELKLRIKEINRVLAHATRDSDLSRSDVQKMRMMEETLLKTAKAFPDCSAMSSVLRAQLYNSEEQLKAEQDQSSYFLQLAGRTYPKGLHCLSMRLTTEFFSLPPDNQQLPGSRNVLEHDQYHYAIFSDNVLACAVVVNSTVSTAKEAGKIVFHIVTDSLNFPAMSMWFLLNPPGQATIHVQSLDDFEFLPSGFSSMVMQSTSVDPRYTSALNHLRFYLPEIFPFLNKVLLLDHDVVVQRDMTGLWSINMNGKVNGAVEACKEGVSFHKLETLVNFSDPVIANTFNASACVWSFGMNMFDLQEWRRQGLKENYLRWHQEGSSRQLWKVGSLPLGQLIFYNTTLALDRRWHLLGLGQDSSIGVAEIEKAAVIHYDGKRKPWLEIAISKYKGYWSKFLDYNNPYLQQCNIHA